MNYNSPLIYRAVRGKGKLHFHQFTHTGINFSETKIRPVNLNTVNQARYIDGLLYHYFPIIFPKTVLFKLLSQPSTTLFCLTVIASRYLIMHENQEQKNSIKSLFKNAIFWVEILGSYNLVIHTGSRPVSGAYYYS